MVRERSLQVLIAAVLLPGTPLRLVAAQPVLIRLAAPSEPVRFAEARLEQALRDAGYAPALTTGTHAAIVIDGSAAPPAVKPAGFEIRKTGASGISVLASDTTGAMYGALDLAEQIRNGGLAAVKVKIENPRFPFRAIKFNLPWSSYRVGEPLQQHTETVRDLRFWADFLDMMAENRFNVLTLWALHPWPYMIRAKNFPKACSFTDSELAGWQTYWHKLFAMARARGIDVYLVDWNVFVSEGFRNNYDPNATVDGPSYSGPSNTTPAVQRYNRESVTQVLEEYPDLAGIGITLGERMHEMDVHQQVKWIEDVYFPAIKAAHRPVKLIYRAALKSSDPAFVRRSIENSGLTGPIWVELKFNVSHGYSTTTLVHAHGGGTGEPYWNPPPQKYKMAWMIRNEDFFLLRWGQPDFIREHVAKNGGPHAGGYFIGSETYIPAKEYGHKPDSPHLTWKYAFEKQWLYYRLWGRLLYDPATPDSIFAAEFDRRYGPGTGTPLLHAYSLVSRMPLRLASLYTSGWDYSLYSEGFLDPGGRSRRNGSPFIRIDDLIAKKTLDPNYVSIQDYVQALAAGRKFEARQVTPPILAGALEKDGREALRILDGIAVERARNRPTLECEMADVRTWAWLSLYMADKIRGGVALQTARLTSNAAERSQAVNWLERAAHDWDEVVRMTSAHIRDQVPLMHLLPLTATHLEGAAQPAFSWANYRSDVQQDIQTARKVDQ